MKEVHTFTSKSGRIIVLRPAVAEDSDHIITTVKSSSNERSYFHMNQFGNDRLALYGFISSLDRENNLILVATSGENIVGVLEALQAYGGSRPQSTHILSVGLHINESYRGEGIGSEMLSYTIEWAKERGYQKLSASIFTPSKRSIHLFSRAGFSEECVKHKQIRIGHEYIDEICMAKFLE